MKNVFLISFFILLNSCSSKGEEPVLETESLVEEVIQQQIVNHHLVLNLLKSNRAGHSNLMVMKEMFFINTQKMAIIITLSQ